MGKTHETHEFIQTLHPGFSLENMEVVDLELECKFLSRPPSPRRQGSVMVNNPHSRIIHLGSNLDFDIYWPHDLQSFLTSLRLSFLHP